MRPADPASGEASGTARGWHVGRARAEVEAAFRAAGATQTAIHLRLGALHLERAWAGEAAAAARELGWLCRFRPLHERAGTAS
jgi:hypothetical protein